MSSRGELDFKAPLIQALLLGCLGVGVYYTAVFLTAPMEEENVEVAPNKKVLTREESIEQVLRELKRELRRDFAFEIPRDPGDGLFEKEVFLRMHCLMYKYKKFGHDMIIEANSRYRISLL